MSGPTRITFPGLNGVSSATVELPSGGRRAVVVVGEAGEEGVPPLRAALVDAGFVAASLDGPVEGLPHVEDVAALAGTLFGSSSATVGLVGLGQASAVATAASGALADVVAAVVLVGGQAEAKDSAVPVVQLEAGAAPADVVKALGIFP